MIIAVLFLVVFALWGWHHALHAFFDHFVPDAIIIETDYPEEP